MITVDRYETKTMSQNYFINVVFFRNFYSVIYAKSWYMGKWSLYFITVVAIMEMKHNVTAIFQKKKLSGISVCHLVVNSIFQKFPIIMRPLQLPYEGRSAEDGSTFDCHYFQLKCSIVCVC